MTSCAVLFDFDGVLVDSFAFCVKAFQASFPEMTPDLCREWFEGPVSETIAAYADSRPQPPPEDWWQDFWRRYAEGLSRSQPVGGMPAIVRRLAESSSLYVISSTRSDIIGEWLGRQGLSASFRDVLGVDVHPSKIAKIGMVREKERVALDRLLLVTDTTGDIQEARTAGIPSLAVSWGYHEKTRLEAARPTAIVDNPAELEAAIERCLGSAAREGVSD